MSAVVGADSMGWRYDPIFTGKIHSVEWHISEFEKMAEILAGYTKTCVISFIDIYKKVERNFPEAKSVRIEDRAMIGKAFVKIASKYGMVLKPCAEGEDLAKNLLKSLGLSFNTRWTFLPYFASEQGSSQVQ